MPMLVANAAIMSIRMRTAKFVLVTPRV